jgi:O-antigen/teichoic acid export membrane protein
MIFALLNAVFWIIAVKFIEADDIGLASAAFSVPVLFTSIAVLSIEYPILKYISKDNSFFGSALVFEIIIHLLLIPILWITFQKITNDSWLFIFAIVIMFCMPIRVITGFSLMGSFSVKPVMLIDIISAGLKISLLIAVAIFQLGSFGIMLALTGQFIFSALVLSIISFKKFGLYMKIKSLKIILYEGISNFPTKIAAVLQYFGSISILALFLIPQEDIAGFTVSYGFIVFISAIPSGLALLAIPSSVEQNKDMSTQSMKWSMILAIPIITVLITSPDLILRIYNDEYIKYDTLLIILAVSIIPFILKTNIITMLNNQNSLKKITILGIIESGIFLAVIISAIPIVGVIGSAWAVTIASFSAAILSLYWANKEIRKIFFISIPILVLGIVSGYTMEYFTNNSFAVLLTGFATSILSLFVFKLVRVSEIIAIIDQIKTRNNKL